MRLNPLQAGPLEALVLAHTAVDAASEKFASNIVLLDLRKLVSFTDYFVVCSADTKRQLNAIADEVEMTLRKVKVLPHHREGAEESGWVLLDYGDVVVHIFAEEQRAYYDLEAVWPEAPALVRMQ